MRFVVVLLSCFLLRCASSRVEACSPKLPGKVEGICRWSPVWERRFISLKERGFCDDAGCVDDGWVCRREDDWVACR